MAMQQVQQGEPQTHILPVFEARVELLNTGGCLSLPDKRFGEALFTGTGKVRRDADAYLNAMQKAYLPKDSMVTITGGFMTLETILTPEQAALGTGQTTWFLKDRMPAYMRNLINVGMSNYVPYVVLRVHLPSCLIKAFNLGLLKVSQEKTDVSQDGSTPTHTRFDVFYDKSNTVSLPPGASETAINCHKWAMQYMVCAMAAGRATVVESRRGCVYHDISDDEDDHDFDEAIECSQGTGPPVIPQRVSEAPTRDLRQSVVVTAKNEQQIATEVERGFKKVNELPDADDARELQSDHQIGPMIVECSGSLKARDPVNEYKGVERHLAAGTRHDYTDKAYKRFVMASDLAEASISTAFDYGLHSCFKECKLPNAWSETQRERAKEDAPFERMHSLKGFVKGSEIGLAVDKRPRLIGNPGQCDAAAAAAFVSPFEQMFCYMFPGFMCKGYTMAQTDAKLTGLLGKGFRLASCDFAAMDSSWHAFEKKAVVRLVKNCANKIIDMLESLSEPVDPLLDGPERSWTGQITWELRNYIVVLDADDGILFSGERGTSIYNRLLVLILRTAEIARFRGVKAAAEYWESAMRFRFAPGSAPHIELLAFIAAIVNDDGAWHEPADLPPPPGFDEKPKMDVDVGDGDDTVFDARDYKNADEIVEAYKAYGKTIEPIISEDGMSLEVLSRYLYMSKAGHTYALVKVKKNLQRLCLASVQAAEVVDGNSPSLNGMQFAEIATSAYNRAIAAAQTPFVRYYALAVGDYNAKRARALGCSEIVFDRDTIRRRPELVCERQSLSELRKTAEDRLAGAHVNGFVMAHWMFWGKKAPTAKAMVVYKDDWLRADDAAREIVVDDSDLNAPSAFAERLMISRHVGECIGLTPILLKCCPVEDLGTAAPRVCGGMKGAGKGLLPKGAGQRKQGPTDRDGGGLTKSLPEKKNDSKGKGKGGKSQGKGQQTRSTSPSVAGGTKTVRVATGPHPTR
jgi:hypothetical protein